MKNFKYFNYGITTDTGTPTYALYCPILDCFLYLLQDITLAKELRFLLSSKYFLVYIIRINCATNYHPHLIDNEICDQWSFTNKNDIDLSQVRYSIHSEPKAVELCSASPVPQDLPDFIDIKKEKQWIMMCAHWLHKLDLLRTTHFAAIADDVNRALNLKLVDNNNDRFKKIERQALQLMYTGTDLNEVDSQLDNLLTNFDVNFYNFNFDCQ